MGGKRFLVSSSRAQPRDLFRLPFAVFLRKSICMKHRDPQSHEAYGVSRSPLPHNFCLTANEKDFSLPLEMTMQERRHSLSFLWKEVARSAGGWLHSLSFSAPPALRASPSTGRGIVSNDRHLHSQPLPIKKRTPASESANPSSQHQLDGSIVPILAQRRKVNHS